MHVATVTLCLSALSEICCAGAIPLLWSCPAAKPDVTSLQSPAAAFAAATLRCRGVGARRVVTAIQFPVSVSGSNIHQIGSANDGDDGAYRREGGAETIGLQSGLGASSLLFTSPQEMTSILDDGEGHINAELARCIWEWENDHLLQSSRSASVSASETMFPASALKFSTRKGLRMVEELSTELLSQQQLNSEAVIMRTDLIQDGTFALMRAMAKFDPETAERNDDSFYAFARREVFIAMEQSLANAAYRPLRIPNIVFDSLRKAKAEFSKMESELEREPTLAEVATRIKIDPNKLQFYQLATRMSLPVESIVEIYDPSGNPSHSERFIEEQTYFDSHGRSEPMLHSGENGEVMEEEEEWIESANKIVAPLRDFIADTTTPDPDHVAEEELMRGDIDDLLQGTLDEMETQIIRLKFGLDGGNPMTYTEIGKKLGISPQRAGQHEQLALDRLRTSYSSSFVELYLDDDHTDEVTV